LDPRTQEYIRRVSPELENEYTNLGEGKEDFEGKKEEKPAELKELEKESQRL
jgi:hypothetical protein